VLGLRGERDPRGVHIHEQDARHRHPTSSTASAAASGPTGHDRGRDGGERDRRLSSQVAAMAGLRLPIVTMALQRS
jgi:hypothetical protein